MQRYYWSQLSLRYKLPLVMAATIIATAIMVSAALSWYTYQQLRSDLMSSAEGICKTLARSLGPQLARDDVWQAFETISIPVGNVDSQESAQRTVVVLDSAQNIFVSTQPKIYPLATPLNQLDQDGNYRLLLADMHNVGSATYYAKTGALAGQILVASPILAEDGLSLGTVIVRFSDSLFLDRFRAARDRVVLTTFVAVMLMLPLAWWLAKRLTEPLTELSQKMTELSSLASPLPQSFELAPANAFADVSHGLSTQRDEIKNLESQFDRMRAGLIENTALKAQVASSERLAAIGRLAAGVAHEINNPLGGMLNALNTYELYGSDASVKEKTMSLLARGLGQIRDTVTALLVEAKRESRALTPDDIADISTLVQGELKQKSLTLEWRSKIDAPVPLPATQIRQIILNLLLNAIHAAPIASSVQVVLQMRNNSLGHVLEIEVINTGAPISAARRDRLFEPYDTVDAPSNSHGLGLWVCYQIVQQLKGHIAVESSDVNTRFGVTIPIDELKAAK
jgi:two-component system, NtrC family, sensor kinase